MIIDNRSPLSLQDIILFTDEADQPQFSCDIDWDAVKQGDNLTGIVNISFALRDLYFDSKNEYDVYQFEKNITTKSNRFLSSHSDTKYNADEIKAMKELDIDLNDDTKREFGILLAKLKIIQCIIFLTDVPYFIEYIIILTF